MNEILTTLKLGLANHLEKQGSSLEEFEKALGELNGADGAIKVAETLTEIAGLDKEAFWDVVKDGVGATGGLLKAIAELGATSAMVGGTTLGAGAYGIHKYLDNQDKEHQEKANEIAHIKALTDRLKQDYGAPR